MNEQLKHYQDKLAFEMDPSDLFDALNNGENVILSMPGNRLASMPSTSPRPSTSLTAR